MENKYYKNVEKALVEDIADRVQRVLHKDVEVINCEGSTWKEAIREDAVQIYLYSGKDVDNLCFSMPDKCYDIPYSSDITIMPSSFDMSAQGLIECIDKGIYFLYDCLADMPKQKELRYKLVDELLNKMTEGKADELADNYTKAITERNFKTLMNKCVDSVKHQKEKDIEFIENTKEKIKNLRADVRQLQGSLLAREDRAKTYDSTIDRAKAQFNAEWSQMNANKKVEKIEIVKDGLIEVYTVPLYVNVDWSKKYDNGKKVKYLLGRYKLVIGVFNGEVNIYNRDECNKRKSYWSNADEHPHVGKGSDICYGNAGNLISACVDRMQWANLVDVVINFCESVNIEDCAGKRVLNWDEIDENGNIVPFEKKHRPGSLPIVKPDYNREKDEDGYSLYEESEVEIEDGEYVCPICGGWVNLDEACDDCQIRIIREDD